MNKRTFLPILLIFTLVLSACTVPDSAELQRDEVPDTPIIQGQLLPETAAVGYIEGSVSYPSEQLPEGLEVCALSLDGNPNVCTSDFIQDSKYVYGFGYKLALVPGGYQVEAGVPGSSLRGLYSEFIPCGQTAACTDHTPLNVTVILGGALEGIDPGDWYSGT